MASDIIERWKASALHKLCLALLPFTTTTTTTTTTNNNNKRICIAQVCRMTSEALGGQLQSCYTARARPKCLA